MGGEGSGVRFGGMREEGMEGSRVGGMEEEEREGWGCCGGIWGGQKKRGGRGAGRGMAGRESGVLGGQGWGSRVGFGGTEEGDGGEQGGGLGAGGEQGWKEEGG